MKKNEDIIQLTNQHVFGTYNRYPIALVKGKGMHVWDKAGNKFMDFVAGVAVNNLGHCHPTVVAAIRKQAGQLMHVSNLYHIEPQSLLAKNLTQQSFAGKIFFCNSGTEANEGAIKLARRYFVDRGEKARYEIITMKQAFHGRTLGSMAATPQDKIQKGFGPLLPGFKYVPFNDIAALKKAITAKTCAVMLEPIQGETGVNILPKRFLKELRALCTREKILLILDEVQTGFGRTGTLFAYENFGIKPDIMTLAKGLGCGFPIGALAATDKVARSFGPGTHGSTFGGNPLACAAALAAFKILSKKSFLKQVQKTGQYFLSQLQELARKCSVVGEVRGMGLILAMDLVDASAPKVTQECLRQGFLVNATGPGTLRFIPPLIVTPKDIDKLTRTLERIFKNL